MYRILFVILTAVLFFAPLFSYADCMPQGYTVVFVNGILTSSEDAGADLRSLQTLLGNAFGAQPLYYAIDYNPSHLDGYGDELESASQALGAPISDFDLDTMLRQLASELTTQKFLLVGHSQGTFYTNELYGYLVAHGVPAASIAVYNIATPASFVAGAGSYLTSSNDKLIDQVRILDAEAGAAAPLPANIIIAPQPGESGDPYGGHHFQSDYLAGAASRIAGDIYSALGKLTGSDSRSDVCFSAPPEGFSDKLQDAVFAITDPGLTAADVVSRKGIELFTNGLSAAGAVGNSATSILNDALQDAIFSVFPRPNAENAGTAFAVEKALYGSSLSEADYEALLEGDDIPEDAPPAPQALPKPVSPAQESVVQSATTSSSGLPTESASSSPAYLAPPLPIPPIGRVTLVSPGFGGGGAPAITEPPQDSEPEDPQNMSSSTDSIGGSDGQQTEGEAQDEPPIDEATSSAGVASTTSATSTEDAPPPAEPPQIQVAVAEPDCPEIQATGYFFDLYQQAEYVDGLLQVHLRLKTPYNDGRPFVSIVETPQSCPLSGPVPFAVYPTTVPAHLTDYSFRMASSTHWALWDDEDDTQLQCGGGCEGDIPEGSPLVYFYASIDGGVSRVSAAPFPPIIP